jgi:glutathione S-transferase
LPESNAILWYLAEGSQFVPSDRLGRAQTLQWMFFEQYSHEPFVATPRYIVKHLPENHARRAELPDRLTKGRAALAVMDAHLKARPFFVAERYTIADIALYAYTHVAHEGGHDLAPYSSVRGWLARVAAQPGHVEIYARPRA